MQRRALREGSTVVVAALAVALALALIAACRSFGAEDPANDPGAGQGVLCGDRRCPAPSVCCFDVDAGTTSCSAKADCLAAQLACTTTFDCVDAGAPEGSVCCAHDDGKKLVRTSCLQGSACDPSGPQDWVCDPSLAPTMQCTDPNRPKCRAYLLAAPVNFGVCGQ